MPFKETDADSDDEDQNEVESIYCSKPSSPIDSKLTKFYVKPEEIPEKQHGVDLDKKFNNYETQSDKMSISTGVNTVY